MPYNRSLLPNVEVLLSDMVKTSRCSTKLLFMTLNFYSWFFSHNFDQISEFWPIFIIFTKFSMSRTCVELKRGTGSASVREGSLTRGRGASSTSTSASQNSAFSFQTISEDIWKHTVEKRQTNATCVILHPIRQAIWGNIWKLTVEKRKTNATCVIMHPLRQANWGNIWKHAVEKSQTNANNVTLKTPIQGI